MLILSCCLLAGVALADVNYSIANGQAKRAAKREPGRRASRAASHRRRNRRP